MSYPKKLLRLRPVRGTAADLPANEVGEDFYTGCSNVQFRSGFAGRVLGSRAAYGTLPTEVLHMLNARVGPTNFWLFLGADDIHANETSNTDDVTGSALTAVSQPWQWASTLLNGVPVVTNGLDQPRYWGGDVGTPFQTLPDWPAATSCKSIVAFQYHLIALDIDGPGGHFEDQLLSPNRARCRRAGRPRRAMKPANLSRSVTRLGRCSARSRCAARSSSISARAFTPWTTWGSQTCL
jgi:hypothetical protein